MKKFISIFLAAVLTAALFTACGRNKNKDNSSSMISGTQSPSPTISSSPSESGMESFPDGSTSNMPDTSMDENSNSGDPGASLRPNEAQNRNLDEFAAALKEEYGGDYLPDTVMDGNEIEEMTGITNEMYDDVYGEKSSMKENPDIFIAVKAKEDKKDEVKKKLEEYKEKMISENSYEAVSERLNSVQIMEQDNYVFLFLLGKSDFGDMAENVGDEISKELKRAEEVIKNMLS